ncbi:response regulator [bacterium]|nr:response regulator [bacterium]
MAQILIIDDDADLRNIIRRMLETAGYSAVCAADGQAGMKLALEYKPDLLITDIIMPDENGIKVIRQFRRMFPGIKILAVSSGGIMKSSKVLVKAKQSGAHKVLRKPFKRMELLMAAEDLISSCRERES